MTSLLLDLRYGARLMRAHRAVTLAAIATMAVAIAANTAIFTLVDQVLLRPLPLPRPDRIVRIEERHAQRRLNLTGATFSDVQERARTLQAVASYRISFPGLSGDGSPQQVIAAEVSPGYFAVLGAGPAAGRGLAAGDFLPGAAGVAIVSDGLWRRSLGADRNAVGRRILINAVPTEIAGVMPSGLFAPGNPDIWLPQASSSPLLRNRRAHLFTVVGRLKDDVTVAASEQELATVAAAIVRDSGAVDPDMTLAATPLQARLTETARPAILVLWAAVGLLLLVAAANVANLLLMQGTVRTRELALRAALGAGRARLARQLATESLLLGLAGGAIGTTLGLWAVPALAAVMPANIPRGATIAADARVAAFGVLLSLAAAVLLGAAPSLRASLARPAGALGARTDGGRSRSAVRSALVLTEVALTVVLLAGAALLGQTLASILRIDPGFNPANVLTFTLSLPGARYQDAVAHDRFYASVLERVAALPGVTAAGVTGALPLSGTPATTMEPERSSVREALSADVITVTPGFFAALQIPVARGRVFTASDTAESPPVIAVNEAAAHRFWPEGGDVIGRTITMKDWGPPYRATVAGIVGNVHQAGPDADVAPAVYYPLAQFPETTLTETIVVRTTAGVDRTIALVQEQIAAVDRDQPIASVRTMADVLSASTANRRFNLTLLASFAAAALLLAGVGIYGTVAFAVGLRAKEIAVRIALGARPADISKLVAAAGAGPVAGGLAVGIAGALAASRLLQGLLFGVHATNAATLPGVVAVVVLVAAAACAGPLRRAKRLDPAVALRGD